MRMREPSSPLDSLAPLGMVKIARSKGPWTMIHHSQKWGTQGSGRLLLVLLSLLFSFLAVPRSVHGRKHQDAARARGKWKRWDRITCAQEMV